VSRRLDWARDGRDWPRREASRFVEAGGLRWHVQLGGSGPAVLLLHGTGAASHSWRALWPHLEGRARLIVPDLPGHGLTGALPRPGLGAMAQAVAALVAELGQPIMTVIGHSAGAAIALQMVLDEAIRPRLLVGLGAALRPLAPLPQLLLPGVAGLMRMNPFLVPAFASASASPERTRRFLERTTGSRIDAEGVRLYARLFACEAHVSAALAMMSAWDLTPLSRRLPGVAVPTLLVHGARATGRLRPTLRARRPPGCRTRRPCCCRTWAIWPMRKRRTW
jgi:magnesium chelatase accessory protein